MSQSIRQSEILELARKSGHVMVDDLSVYFGVTVQTVRRDLSELAESGKLERVHGGAVLPSGVTNIGYEHRRALNSEAKAAMAERCAKAIPEHASLFLNIGTSTEAVARALLHHRGLLVVTNNINVANILAANAECEVIVAGGSLRRSDGGLVGGLTARAVEQFKIDFAVVGCSALDTDGDLLDFDVQEVGVSQTILRQARARFLVADSSKFERTAPARIASLRDIDCFFTDRLPPRNVVTLCRGWSTRIDIAGAAAGSDD